MPPATEIAPGLWRWSAPHPDWKPGAEPGSSSDWEQQVGCLLVLLERDAALIDPLLAQSGREQMLAWLDERLAGRSLHLLTTIEWHRRDRDQLALRYRDQLASPSQAPAGIRALPIEGASETLFWLEGAGALVAGDSLIADPSGRIRVCPESWLADVRISRRELAGELTALLELPIERLLVSHGRPALAEGRRALELAVAEVLEG